MTMIKVAENDDILSEHELMQQAAVTAEFYMQSAMTMTAEFAELHEARLKLVGDLCHIMAMDYHTAMAERRDRVRRQERI